jgi:L-ascorbate metabolism protein UlaG (beta-lactamase superfamily)
VDSVTWLGHSSVVVEVDGTRLATDPLLRRRVAHLRRDRAVPREALGRIDALLISHVHLDHLDTASLRGFDRTLPVLMPRHAGSILRRRGFRRVQEVEPGEVVAVRDVRVEVTPAEHGEVRRFVRARSSAVGYVVRGSHDVYFAGDTDLFEGMRDLRPVDVALLPIAGWGPRLPPGHLDAARAAEALTLLAPQTAVPIHWGTYSPLYARPRAHDPAEAFRAAAAQVAPGVRVVILGHGESLDL